jgi:hypothetical protein
MRPFAISFSVLALGCSWAGGPQASDDFATGLIVLVLPAAELTFDAEGFGAAVADFRTRGPVGVGFALPDLVGLGGILVETSELAMRRC